MIDEISAYPVRSSQPVRSSGMRDRMKCPLCGREPLTYPDRETGSWGTFCPTPWCRMLRAHGPTFEDSLGMWDRIVAGMSIDPLEVMD